ncbi:MAG: zf-HC2 domain-containing protein [Phycisphaerales bacterium]|nr:zf-HC2 domain-containing protein [Phycisphaerales bacterium]
MSACNEILNRLGEFIDGELPPTVRAEFQDHLNHCADCRNEFHHLVGLTGSLAAIDQPPVPDGLWNTIEHRLDGLRQEPGIVRSSRRWTPTARLATAAAIILAAGLTLVGVLSIDRSAQAADINFAVLLDGLPFSVDHAFAKFLSHNHGRQTTVAEARRIGKNLSFNTPQQLPGGFVLREVYALRVGDNPGVAARYERNGEFLAAIFHKPVRAEEFGSHRDYPCVVGKHRGHMVAVGQWKLVHFTDPTTCHCLLSRLDETTELPPIMAAVAPRLRESSTATDRIEPRPDHPPGGN